MSLKNLYKDIKMSKILINNKLKKVELPSEQPQGLLESAMDESTENSNMER